jgi:hypothetical protein
MTMTKFPKYRKNVLTRTEVAEALTRTANNYKVGHEVRQAIIEIAYALGVKIDLTKKKEG